MSAPEPPPLDFFTPPTPVADTAGEVAIDMANLGTIQSAPVGKVVSAEGFAAPEPTPAAAPAFGLPQNVATSMVTTMLRGAHEQASARGFFDFYSQIDGLRPYFDVETEEVRQRLLWSFHPMKGSMLIKQFDLYSPLMLAFTLAAVNVMGIKGARHADSVVEAESTTLGTSLFIAFMPWLCSTVLLYVAAQVSLIALTPDSIPPFTPHPSPTPHHPLGKSARHTCAVASAGHR